MSNLPTRSLASVHHTTRCWIAAVRTHYLVLLFFTLAGQMQMQRFTSLSTAPDPAAVLWQVVYFPRLCLSYAVFFLAEHSAPDTRSFRT